MSRPCRRSGSAPGEASAFTLTELLAVVAILAILAAVLFPVVSRARGEARQATCLSNLTAVGSALRQYAQDYDQTYPARITNLNSKRLNTGWAMGGNEGWISNALVPYAQDQGIYVCPSYEDKGDWLNPRSDKRVSYAYNYHSLTGHYTRPSGTRLREVAEPASLLVMWESRSPWADCDYESTACGWRVRDWAVHVGAQPHRAADVHAEGRNSMLFADGHAALGSWDETKWQNLNVWVRQGSAAYDVPVSEPCPAGTRGCGS